MVKFDSSSPAGLPRKPSYSMSFLSATCCCPVGARFSFGLFCSFGRPQLKSPNGEPVASALRQFHDSMRVLQRSLAPRPILAASSLLCLNSSPQHFMHERAQPVITSVRPPPGAQAWIHCWRKIKCASLLLIRQCSLHAISDTGTIDADATAGARQSLPLRHH